MLDLIEPSSTRHFVERVPDEITLVYYGHDYQIGRWWSDSETNRDGYNRMYPETVKNHRPETVATYEKENRVNLSPAWDWFNKDLFLLSAFGIADRSRFPEIQTYFDFVMADNRVIVNGQDYPNGYMPLAMGGGYGHVIGEDNLPNFGPCWTIEALDASGAPPDVEKVYYEQHYLWNEATICRWAKPEDNIQGLVNPWQHVTPFSHIAWTWGNPTPLMLISNTGIVHVPKGRCLPIVDGIIPDPYNPPLGWNP